MSDSVIMRPLIIVHDDMGVFGTELLSWSPFVTLMRWMITTNRSVSAVRCLANPFGSSRNQVS